MILKGVFLKNFRNYSSQEIELSPGFNCIIGENGAGKTNILEAIGLLSTLKSFRGASDTDMMQWGTTSFFCSASMDSEPFSFEMGCAMEDALVRKRLKIDTRQVRRASEFFGRLPSVTFSPLDIAIINEGPEIRRRFFDGALAKTDPAYLKTYGDFRRILMSRNRVLKDIRLGNIRESELDVWDELFTDAGWRITETRIEFLEKFSRVFMPVYGSIADDDPPSILYRRSWKGESRNDFRASVSSIRSRELAMGISFIGPQRDDYLILNSRGISFSSSASQGQRRMAAVSLRLAEGSVLEQSRKEAAIVLVDDVFSELDSCRRRNLVEHLGGKRQIIITMVDSDCAQGLDGAAFFIAGGGKVLRR